MARKVPAVPLPTLAAGINRFEHEIGPNQAADGLNVIEDQGDLKRRDAFRAFATTAPFILPAGKTILQHFLVAGSVWTVIPDRTLDQACSTIGGTNGTLYIGCTVPFDGFDWRDVQLDLSETSNARLLPAYWNGASWVSLPWFLDTTIRNVRNGSNNYLVTLKKNGAVSWHRSQLSDWSPTSLNSISRYWIRLNTVSGTLPGGTIETDAPGCRAFLLEPATGIFPARFKDSISAILVGSDRRSRRGQEGGAQLGALKQKRTRIETISIVDDEGAGAYGQIAWPKISKAPAVGNTGWPSGSGWSTSSAATGSYGTSGTVLTKNQRLTVDKLPYEWQADSTHVNDQWRGAKIYNNLAPTASMTQSSTTKLGSFSCTVSNLAANEWEGCKLICTSKGAGGTPVGEEREIAANTASSVTYYDIFSITPDASNRFSVLRPHARAKFKQDPDNTYEINANTAHTATLETTRPFTANGPNLANEHVHWEIGQELQWRYPAGDFWNGCYDVITKRLILTNGKCPLLTYDGIRVRELEALFDPDDPLVAQYIGVLPDDSDVATQVKFLSRAILRVRPPHARIVVDFNSRFVVSDGIYIRWSAPGDHNVIWPAQYETQVRDSENQQVVGLATLNDNLYAWTPNSIHAAGPADDNGMIFFNPVSQGLGFVCHRAVCKIANEGSSMLIGPNADGVYLYNGTQPIPVLGDWRHLLEGGVNGRLLKNCVGAVSRFRNEYYLAVPSAGSQVLDQILVYNYERKRWWVWEAPWGGVSDIARDFDEFGMERVIFAFADGHLALLEKAETDDGDTVEGFAKSPPVSPLGNTTFAVTGLMVMAKETGPLQTLTIKSYLNRADIATQEYDAPFDAGANAFDETSQKYGAVTGSNVQATFAGEPMVTRKINLPKGTKCQSYQFEVRGTGRWVFRQAEILASPKGQRSK